jgi:hypothetical protein
MQYHKATAIQTRIPWFDHLFHVEFIYVGVDGIVSVLRWLRTLRFFPKELADIL